MKKTRIGIICFLWVTLHGQVDQPLQYQVRVQERAVPVYALDEKGEPVADLAKEEIDFYVRGKKIDLDLFIRRLISGEPAAGTGESPDQNISAVQERIIYLVINPCGLSLKHARRMKDIMKEIVQQARPRDRFVIITSQARNGNFLFAGPEPASPQLLQKIEKMNTRLISLPWRIDYLHYAFQIFPQPKVVYLLSQGMPLNTVNPQYNMSYKLARMFKEAGVAVLAVDILDFQGPRSREGLQFITDETGGRFLADNDIGKILTAVKKTEGAYYEAIFNLSQVPAFENYQLKIVCRRPGVRLIAPRTLIQPRAYARMSDFEKDLFATDALEGGSWSRIQTDVKRPEFKIETGSVQDQRRLKVAIAIPEEMVDQAADIYLIRSAKDNSRGVKIDHLNRVLQKSERIEIAKSNDRRPGFVIVSQSGQRCLASWLN